MFYFLVFNNSVKLMKKTKHTHTTLNTLVFATCKQKKKDKKPI